MPRQCRGSRATRIIGLSLEEIQPHFPDHPLVGLGKSGKGKGSKGKRKERGPSDLEKMFTSGTIDVTLAGDGAEVAKSRRVGLRQKPQPAVKGQQLLPTWGASEPTAGGAAAISRLDGDEPDGDNSFGDDFAEAMEDLDNDNEQWTEPGSWLYTYRRP